MDVHPVLILFAILALAAAFGIVGALLAAPLAAIVKAYYEAFYVNRRADDPGLDDRVQRMLHVERVEPAASQTEPEEGSAR
jgi:predicted PurR-regulated permease PerM